MRSPSARHWPSLRPTIRASNLKPLHPARPWPGLASTLSRFLRSRLPAVVAGGCGVRDDSGRCDAFHVPSQTPTRDHRRSAGQPCVQLSNCSHCASGFSGFEEGDEIEIVKEESRSASLRSRG